MSEFGTSQTSRCDAEMSAMRGYPDQPEAARLVCT